MWTDAILAYLHFTAIFILFAFLTAEIFGAAAAVLVTGFLRLVLGAKGPDFYLNSWPIYVKLALFLAVGLISVTPTLAFIRWRRALDHEAQWKVPEEERARMRRLIMIEVHLAALIPLIAVIMSRGLGT